MPTTQVRSARIAMFYNRAHSGGLHPLIAAADALEARVRKYERATRDEAIRLEAPVVSAQYEPQPPFRPAFTDTIVLAVRHRLGLIPKRSSASKRDPRVVAAMKLAYERGDSVRLIALQFDTTTQLVRERAKFGGWARA